MSLSIRREVAVDIVRIVAAIAVVTIHVTDALIILPNHFGGISWWWANLLNSFSRNAVPVFVMLSGYLYLNPAKRINTDTYYKDRYIRAGLPFVFWLPFYYWWNSHHNRIEYSIGSIASDLFRLSLFHLYFLVVILVLYMVTPRLKRYTDKASSKSLAMTIGILFLTGAAVTLTVYNYQGFADIRNVITIPFFFSGYYMSGALFRRIRVSTRTSVVLLAAYIICGVLAAAGAYLNTKNGYMGGKNFGQYFHEPFSPFVILMSLAFFAAIICRHTPLSGPQWLNTTISAISTDTFVVYLIHPLILDMINTYLHMNIHEMSSAIWLWITVKIAIVFLCSLAAAILYRRLWHLVKPS